MGERTWCGETKCFEPEKNQIYYVTQGAEGEGDGNQTHGLEKEEKKGSERTLSVSCLATLRKRCIAFFTVSTITLSEDGFCTTKSPEG